MTLTRGDGIKKKVFEGTPTLLMRGRGHEGSWGGGGGMRALISRIQRRLQTDPTMQNSTLSLTAMVIGPLF